MSGAPPTLSSRSVGDKVTAADEQVVKAALDALSNPDRVHAWQQTTATTLTTGTAGLILFDAEAYDTNAMHSIASNTSRVVATVTGLYFVSVCVTFASNATGIRLVQLRKNAAGSSAGGTAIGDARAFTANGTNSSPVSFSDDIQFSAGDYFEVFATQTSGGNLNTNLGSQATFAKMRWVAAS